MKDIIVKGKLLDFYGELLTERQRYCMEQYYEGDMSLTEIADHIGVSRQAVHDNITRATAVLCEYEEKLHLIEGEERRQEVVKKIVACLDTIPIDEEEKKMIEALLEQL